MRDEEDERREAVDDAARFYRLAQRSLDKAIEASDRCEKTFWWCLLMIIASTLCSAIAVVTSLVLLT